MFKKISAVIAIVLIPCFLFMNFHQDNGKNEIRILLERGPLSLNASQSTDIIARRVLPLLTEFHYQIEAASLVSLSEEFTLLPQDASKPKLHFIIYKDETTRAIQFLRGKADVLFNATSLTKTRWLQRQGFQFFEKPGFYLQCLGFNLNDPTLKNFNVRNAIAQSLPIQDWIKYKYFDFALESPDAPVESPSNSEKILDEAGFRKNERGQRFKLKYFTTPVREGNELALMVREALGKVGIEVDVIPLEFSHFYSKLKRGDFQLTSTGIYRSSEEDGLNSYFLPDGPRNYFQYKNPEILKRLGTKKNLTWNMIHDLIKRDLPCVPLFFWKNDLLLSDRVGAPQDTAQNLDDSFRFLPSLTLK